MNSHFKHFFVAYGYTVTGLKVTFKHEIAFRQEVAVLLIILPIVYWLDLPLLHKALLISSWLLVLVAELLNTGLESAIDRIGTEQHELSGRAKDQGSAAVAITIIIATIIWLGVLL